MFPWIIIKKYSFRTLNASLFPSPHPEGLVLPFLLLHARLGEVSTNVFPSLEGGFGILQVSR